MTAKDCKDSAQITIENNEIFLSGILNFENTPQILKLLKRHFKKHQRTNTEPLILNLSDVTQSDSSGLALLTGVTREAQKNNFILKINNIPQKLLDLAKLTGVNTILPLN